MMECYEGYAKVGYKLHLSHFGALFIGVLLLPFVAEGGEYYVC